MLWLVWAVLGWAGCVEGSWWLLAMPSTSWRSLTGGDGRESCGAAHLLVPGQQELCRQSPDLLPAVSAGAQLGLHECQAQFSRRHWNCSTQPQPWALLGRPRALAPAAPRPKLVKRRAGLEADAVFGRSLRIKSREKAYVHAISAAGVSYAITRACARGNLSRCGCDEAVGTAAGRTARLVKGAEPFEWGGCSEDVDFGVQLGGEFVDAGAAAAKDEETRLMNLHNGGAGRRALRRSARLKCKCHGVSGSCSTRVCWRSLPPFKAVGARLFRKWDDAVLVELLPSRQSRAAEPKGRLLTRSLSGSAAAREPRAHDLVYTEASPDYCVADGRRGIAGTAGRECEENGSGPNSCRILCCARGFRSEIVHSSQDCNCRFVWCCQVQCDTCTQSRLRHFCR